MKRKSNKKKEVLVLDGKNALLHSANKLNRSMAIVFTGCGAQGDKKFNRNKSKRAAQREVRDYRGGSFYFLQ